LVKQTIKNYNTEAKNLMLKNILYSFFTKGIVALINFLILIASARYLGVSSRGEISVFVLNIALIQILNEIYTGYSLVHFLPQFNFKKIVVHGIVFTLLFSTLSSSIFSLYRGQVQGYEISAYILTLLVLVNTFFCVIILSKKNIKLYSLLSFLQPLLLLLTLLLMIFVFHDYTFRAYFVALMCSFVVAIIFSGAAVARYYFQTQPQKPYLLKPIIYKGFAFQVALFMFVFMNRYSYYLLPKSSDVGLYATACSLMESVLIIAYGVAPVLLTEAANDKIRKHSATLTLSIARISFVAGLFGYLVIQLLPNSFYDLLIGKAFDGIKRIIMLYGPATLLQTVILILTSYFTGSGQQKSVLFSYSVGFLNTLIFAPILISIYGISGAAATALISYGAVAFIMTLLFLKRENISFGHILKFSEDFYTIKKLAKLFKA